MATSSRCPDPRDETIPKTPYGIFECFIAILVKSIGQLNNPKKIKPEIADKYGRFFAAVKSIAVTITNIQRDLEKSTRDRRDKYAKIIKPLISSFKGVINTIIERIDKIVEKSGHVKYQDVSDERKFIDVMAAQLRTTGEISSDLLVKINSTQNHALDRYLISILSDQYKSTKYPWTYYVPTINDLKDRLMDVYTNNDETKPDEIKTKYVHNFVIMVKQVYAMTKTNVRNISMIRLADLNDASAQFTKYKGILEKLLFTSVDNEFVPDDYNSLLGKYTSHTNSLARLLGRDNYKKLIYHIEKDGRSFRDDKGNPTKTIKTETLLKYILIAIQQVVYSDVEQHAKFYDAIVSFIEKVLEANANIADLSSIVELSDKEFNRSDLSTRHNRENNIFTFVKIRADKVNSLVETNQRYRIGLDQERQIMYMGYEPAPESIYDINLSLKKEFQYLSSNENLLPNNYLFGPFSYIFKPADDNSVISNHKSMSPLLDNIKNGKSVCVIGYGASGSGKTTALVYAGFESTQEKRNGILIHFCNMLRDTYGEIEVSFLELEGNIKEDGKDAVSNFKILPIPNGDEKKLNADKSFVYTDEDKKRQEYYSSRSFTVDPKSGEWILSENSDLDEIDGVSLTKGVDIGKYIVTIMDGKRSIQATTNNPVSSRSHMIIFVKFKYKKSEIAQEKEPYLIICDFAGVENKFQCRSDDVLEMFEKIKSQTKCKDKKSSVGQCQEFENFYDVQSRIDEKLRSDDAMYNPEPTINLNISHDFSQMILDNILPTPIDPKHPAAVERKSFEPYASYINSIATEVYNSGKYEKFLSALEKIKQVVGTPEYPTKKSYNNMFENSESIVKRWLGDLYKLFNLSKMDKEVKTFKTGKLPIERVMTDFVHSMYNKYLRRDDYDNLFAETKKGIAAGTSMNNRVVAGVVEKAQKTVSTPAINNLITYLTTVINHLSKQDSKNQEINERTNKRNEIVGSAKSSRKQMLSQICNERVKEGLFINDSLRHLRGFISHFVTGIQNNGGKIVNPKFVDECAPLQCNPNFEDCFGNTTVLEKDINESSTIANEIRNRLCCVDKDGKGKIGCKPKVTCEDFKEVTFCIFNVINLTKKTNNPPPIPHIDLTNLMMELSRLESIKTMLVMDEYRISDDMTATYVHPVYLDQIKTSNLLSDMMSGSIKGDDKKAILHIISILEGYRVNPPDVNTTINALKLLINTINMSNSLSLIGTMEFTDMISKFGLNRTTCNYQYQEIVALPKLKGKDLEEFKSSVTEYKSFILNLHSKYNGGIIES